MLNNSIAKEDSQILEQWVIQNSGIIANIE